MKVDPQRLSIFLVDRDQKSLATSAIDHNTIRHLRYYTIKDKYYK